MTSRELKAGRPLGLEGKEVVGPARDRRDADARNLVVRRAHLAFEQVFFLFDRCPVVGIGRMGLKTGDAGPGLGQFDVQGNKLALIIWHVFFGINGVDGALGNADCAVDALIWVNDQKVWALAEAVHGTDVYTVGVAAFDTGFGNDVGHDWVISEYPRLWALVTLKTKW